MSDRLKRKKPVYDRQYFESCVSKLLEKAMDYDITYDPDSEAVARADARKVGFHRTKHVLVMERDGDFGYFEVKERGQLESKKQIIPGSARPKKLRR